MMRTALARGVAPLRRLPFRRLWVVMGSSYAGDRLQELAQAWLVAQMTQSALAVGGIGIIAAIPQLLMPLGGVIADQTDRRRLLITGQIVGGVAALAVGALVLMNRVALWHIYAWAFISGLIWLFSRPAFKVVLTETVPPEEAASATALNSITETAAMVVVSGLGSGLLTVVGLPAAFVLNSLSYVLAAVGLRRLESAEQQPARTGGGLSTRRLAPDLRDGLVYLFRQPRLLYPLLLTLATMVAASPTFGVLAAIVQQQGGTLVQLGLLSASGSLGGMAGAAYAGMSGAGPDMRRRYGIYALVVAAALTVFAVMPIGYLTTIPLAAIGFVLFAEAVWNTSRVRLLAQAAYQARLQSLTTMAFTLGAMLGQLWGGAAVDQFGPAALVGGAALLGLVGAVIALMPAQGHDDQLPTDTRRAD
jgi:MFS family permease